MRVWNHHNCDKFNQSHVKIGLPVYKISILWMFSSNNINILISNMKAFHIHFHPLPRKLV